MHNLTFTAFSDLHDNPGRFYTNAAERLNRIIEAAYKSNSTMLLHAGDFCHDYTASQKLLNQYAEISIPTYHTLGNHDCEIQPYTEVINRYGMPSAYYYADIDGFRFLFLDTNYYWDHGEFHHFSSGNHSGISKDKRYYIPPDQLYWMENTISASPFPCIVISHHSFEREIGGVQNSAEVKEILYRERKVMLCINGHHHRDHLRILDGICWLELNSASYNWLQKPHTLFPEEITEKFVLSPYMAIYNDPLYAVITISEDGTVEIQGVQSSFFMGVSREISGNTALDECGRPARPRITSAVIKGCNVGRVVES